MNFPGIFFPFPYTHLHSLHIYFHAMIKQQEDREADEQPLLDQAKEGRATNIILDSRFNREKIYITDYENNIAIEAFRRGLLAHSELYKILTKCSYPTMKEVLSKASEQIKLEEDEMNDCRSTQ